MSKIGYARVSSKEQVLLQSLKIKYKVYNLD